MESLTDNTTICAEFFNTLFGEKKETDYVMIWTLPDKKSFFTKSLEDASEYVEKNAQEKDVYFGVGTSPIAYGQFNRCPKDAITGIPGFYLDIDVAHPLHNKKNLPPTIEDAIALATFDIFEPTYVINSGHGIQVYYLFDEFWTFTCPEERHHAADMNVGLHEIVKSRAMANGWVIDSVFDLSRILRVPGTYNRKDPKSIEMVFILDEVENQYPLDILCESIKNLRPKQEFAQIKRTSGYTTEIQALADELVVSSSNEISQDKIEDIKITFSDFQKDWENINTGTMADTSASAYDMKLAIKAAQLNWTDQEICDLLISHRLHHGHDLKLKNKQYYARSILSSRAFVQKKKAETAVKTEEEKDLEEISKEIVSPKDMKDELYMSINARISTNNDIKILKITKYIEDPEAIYYIDVEYYSPDLGRTNRKEHILGGIDNLMEYRLFRKKIAGITNVVIKHLSKAEWASLSKHLVAAVYEQFVAQDSTDLGQINMWLSEFLKQKIPLPIEEGYEVKEPFVNNNCWYIWRDKFFRWAKYAQGYNDNVKSLSLNLTRFGCRQETLFFRHASGERLSCVVWSLPTGLFIRKPSES